MRAVRLALHASALFVGAAVGCGSVVVHRIDVLQLPAGLLLALCTSFALAFALRTSDVPQLATSYALGWLVLFGTVLAGRPEGDYAIASDPVGYTLIVAAFAMVVVAVTSLAAHGSGSVGGPT